MRTTYDTIGINYSNLRKPDTRIAAEIDRALGTADTILNVGAGAGSYEPTGRQVTALEPSQQMILQRGPSAAQVVQGYAENLPFDDNSFDAAMAVLTVHHWHSKEKGLTEMRRVSQGPVVILTYDPAFRGFWLTDYFPELITLDEAQMPDMAVYETWLGAVEISAIPIPHDCTDGFLCAYWRRPKAYLDARVRAAMSSFWAIKNVSEGLRELNRDLDSGTWEEKYGDLLTIDACDLGYRLVTTT